ncbi:MAG: cupin domain-containing protein [Burkholderiaceae bacterium]|nr:cupin domain-containing protein [Burkholderiaceae bacterium]
MTPKQYAVPPSTPSTEPAGGHAGGPKSRPSVERVRHQLLGRIAEASTPQHLTVAATEDGWEPFLDGIRCKVLHEDAGALSYLLRLAPGAVLPAHRHPQDEECLVLEGELQIGDALTVSAGGYHLARAGVLHAAITSQAGATIFLRGACPEVSHGI